MNKNRKIISWVSGIIFFFILFYSYIKISIHFDLPTDYYIDGEEVEIFPYGFFLLCLLISVRIGMRMYYGNFKEGIKKEDLFIFHVFVGGLLIYDLIWIYFLKILEYPVPIIIQTPLIIIFWGYNFYIWRGIKYK